MPRIRPTIVVILLTFAIFHFPFSIRAASAAPRVINIGPSGTTDLGMRTVKTKHYELHTDLDAALVADLSTRMDTMYDEYARRLSEFHPPADAPALPVYLFSRESDYVALTKNKARNTAGVFVVEGDKAYLAAFLEGRGRDSLRRTLQHEAFHQFAFFAINHDLPIWLNEGLAQFFEEGIWTGAGKTFWVSQVPPRRLWDLQDKIKEHKFVEFKKFLAITPDQWQKNLSGDLAAGDLYYQQAWAMVQFLVAGGKPEYRTRLIDYLKRLHAGEDADKAFEESFSNNIKGFQDRFSEWVVSVQPTAEATLIHRQAALAELMLRIDSSDRKFDNMLAFRNYVLSHFQQGKSSEMPQAYFSDLSNDFYGEDMLFFKASSGAPLPDIVCRATPKFQIRTHFYRLDGKTEYEQLVEPGR